MSGNVFELRQALVRASKRPQKLRHEDYTTSYRNPLLYNEAFDDPSSLVKHIVTGSQFNPALTKSSFSQWVAVSTRRKGNSLALLRENVALVALRQSGTILAQASINQNEFICISRVTSKTRQISNEFWQLEA